MEQNGSYHRASNGSRNKPKRNIGLSDRSGPRDMGRFSTDSVVVWELPWQLSGKESAFSAGATGDTDLVHGSGRSPGEGHGNPLHYSCLENPKDRLQGGYSPWDCKESDMTEVTQHVLLYLEDVSILTQTQGRREFPSTMITNLSCPC